MKIGIDARMLATGFGLGRYVEQLILGLQEIDDENQYIIFVRKIDEEKIKKDNFRQVVADIPWYGWAEQVKFLKIINRERLDLMHFPHWNIPFFYRGDFVVTLHDLTMFHFPRPEATTLGPLKFFIKDRAHRLIVKRAARAAREIIATSIFTREDARATLGVAADKMTVIYQAPFETINNKQLTINRELILDKYKISQPYVLYVGAAYPHKNLPGLLRAWRILMDKYKGDYQLVLAGKDSYFYNQLKPGLARQPSVRHIGLVSDQELDALYTRARLFVFPSLYEGFGLPPLEAARHGVPVAASAASCLPEILGEGAAYFDPQNYEQMAAVIFQTLTDEERRHALRDKMKLELTRYSREKMARETLAVYQRQFVV